MVQQLSVCSGNSVSKQLKIIFGFYRTAKLMRIFLVLFFSWYIQSANAVPIVWAPCAVWSLAEFPVALWPPSWVCQTLHSGTKATAHDWPNQDTLESKRRWDTRYTRCDSETGPSWTNQDGASPFVKLSKPQKCRIWEGGDAGNHWFKCTKS